MVGTNNNKEAKKDFHGVRVDQIYAFKLLKSFVAPNKKFKRFTRFMGSVEDQIDKENATKRAFDSIVSRNLYLNYDTIWTKDTVKSFHPLLPLEFKVRTRDYEWYFIVNWNFMLRQEGFSPGSKAGLNTWENCRVVFFNSAMI